MGGQRGLGTNIETSLLRPNNGDYLVYPDIHHLAIINWLTGMVFLLFPPEFDGDKSNIVVRHLIL